MSREKIFLSPPHIGPEEYAMCSKVLDSNWIAPLGPEVDAFEARLGEHFPGRSVALTNSGTAALHLALMHCGVGPGDIVCCATFTFAASANPIVYLGAIPVFIGSEAATWNMSPEFLAEALKKCAAQGKKPKAVIGVDLYGMPARWHELQAVCREFDVPLIQDAAESLGSIFRGEPCGMQTDFGILSFNGNKIITTGGGGALVCREVEYAERTRFLAAQAREPAPYYLHKEIGYNYRLNNMLAGIGSVQLSRLAARVAARRENFAAYQTVLGSIPGFSFPQEPVEVVANRWLTTLTIDPKEAGVDEEIVRTHLASLNIESRPLWKPLHTQPVFKNCEYFGDRLAEDLFAKGLCLPSGSALRGEQRDFIVGQIIGLLR